MQRTVQAWSRHAASFALTCASLAILVIALFCCRVSGDTRATLLVSQEIVRHGTVRLDRYDADLHGYPVTRKNGHTYDFFPLGTPLLSAPFVGAANLLGFDARDHADALQIAAASTAIVALLWLLFGTARLFVEPWPAAGLAAVCVFGTSVASTGLSSLYSHDFAALAATAAIFLVVRGVRQDARTRPSLVAICLFLAYLCRPTMALLAPFLLAYLFLYRRGTALKCAALLAGLLACFAFWSRFEYGQWLPDYYLPGRLAATDSGTASWQYLFGPSRGLFVFSPFLALVPAISLPLLLFRGDDYARTLLIGWAWPLAHWLAISRFPHWWGGWSYGPRLMMDCLPGLFLALFHSLSLLGRHGNRGYALTGVLGAFSVQVNVVHAFANHYSILWNSEPNVDEYPEYLSDWRYPQFLHDAERHRRRLEEFERIRRIPADSPGVQFAGLSAAHDELRWNTGTRLSIHLPLQPGDLPRRLVVAGEVTGSQVLRIGVNGHEAGEGRYAGSVRIPITPEPDWLVAGDNVVGIELIDAPATGDLFAFRSLAVFPSP